MSKKPIIKTEDLTAIPNKWEIREWIREHGLTFPTTVCVKFKKNKRWKLKKLHLISFNVNPCELCGEHAYLTYRLGGITETKEMF